VTDWNGLGEFDDALLGDDEDGQDLSFDAEEAEMGFELLGLKNAIASAEADRDTGIDDQETQVEELGRMMAKLQAIKDTSSAMPEVERKRFASKAVSDLMKTLR